MTDSYEPIECPSVGTSPAGRTLDWFDLDGRAGSAERVDGGAALTLGADLASSVEELSELEASWNPPT